MTYINYLYVQKNNGFVDNVKFMQELDLSTIKPGDNIKVYYNESYPFYNSPIKNDDTSYSLFIDNMFVTVTQNNIESHIQELFPKLLNQVVSSSVGDLLNDYTSFSGKETNSLFKEYLQTIQYKTHTQFEPEAEDFSLQKYQQLANQLWVLSECLENIKLSHFIKSSVRAFNTFLGYEGIVSDFSGGSFQTSTNEDTNVEEIYFGDARRALSYAQDRCEYNLTLKLDTKKLKM